MGNADKSGEHLSKSGERRINTQSLIAIFVIELINRIRETKFRIAKTIVIILERKDKSHSKP